MWYCALIGGVLALISVVPVIPWRYAKPDLNCGARFMMDRRYSLLTVGDRFGGLGTWMTLRKVVCTKTIDFNKPSIANMGIQALAGPIGMGNAMVGCESWPNCKKHVAERCVRYTTMATTSICCMIGMLFGAGAGISVLILHNNEKSAGKAPEKQLQAKAKTAFTCVCGAVAVSVSTFGWMAMTDLMFNSFKLTSYYPFPMLFVGWYIALLACIFLVAASICATLRVKNPMEKKAKGDGFTEGGQAQIGYGQPGYDMGGNMQMGYGQPGMQGYDQPMGPGMGMPGVVTPGPGMGMDPSMGPGFGQPMAGPPGPGFGQPLSGPPGPGIGQPTAGPPM